MKIKLAIQLLSQSVAIALDFCKNNLNLEDFQNAGATIKFSNIFNVIYKMSEVDSLRNWYNKIILFKGQSLVM